MPAASRLFRVTAVRPDVTELHDAVLEEAAERGERLLVEEFVELAERRHDGPGVPESVLDDYLEELSGESDVDAAALRSLLDDRRTDSETYENADAVYEVGDGRLSAYPAAWHERLDADDSLAAFVATMTGSMDEPPRSGASSGVAETDLVDAAVTLGDRSRADARGELEALRDQSVLAESADQHPRAGVTLGPEADVDDE